MKRIRKRKNRKSFDQLGVLIEHMDDGLNTVVEGQQAIAKQIDDVDEKLDENIRDSDFKFDALGKELRNFEIKTENNFKRVDVNFKGIEANFKSVFEYLSRVDDELQSVKAGLKEIKEELKRKVDLERVLKLEVRLVNVEKELERYKNRLA